MSVIQRELPLMAGRRSCTKFLSSRRWRAPPGWVPNSGSASPVRAWAFARVPGMLTGVKPRVSSPVLVGRSGQLSALDSALAEVGRGSPSAVMVGGEAGGGESPIGREVAGRARGAGGRALMGGGLDWKGVR